jgi:hypothetical protein
MPQLVVSKNLCLVSHPTHSAIMGIRWNDIAWSRYSAEDSRLVNLLKKTCFTRWESMARSEWFGRIMGIYS